MQFTVNSTSSLMTRGGANFAGQEKTHRHLEVCRRIRTATNLTLDTSFLKTRNGLLRSGSFRKKYVIGQSTPSSYAVTPLRIVQSRPTNHAHRFPQISLYPGTSLLVLAMLIIRARAKPVEMAL